MKRCSGRAAQRTRISKIGWTQSADTRRRPAISPTHQIFKRPKDPLARRGVPINPLRALRHAHNQAHTKEADRDEDLGQERGVERVGGAVGRGRGRGRGDGVESRGAALDDEDKGGKDDNRDELEDVAREKDEGGRLRGREREYVVSSSEPTERNQTPP